MPKPAEVYRTPNRLHGRRSGDTDPRAGEDPTRDGQKEFVPDPDGMKPTDGQGQTTQDGCLNRRIAAGTSPLDADAAHLAAAIIADNYFAV